MPYPTVEEGESLPWVTWYNSSQTDSSKWYDEVSPDPETLIPLAFGAAFVAVPYVVGGAIVVFAPPPWKPVGLAMLAPSPMDAVYFSAGYYVGEQFVEVFYD